MPIEALFCGLNVKARRFSVKLSEASETQRGRDGGQQETARRVGNHGDAPPRRFREVRDGGGGPDLNLIRAILFLAIRPRLSLLDLLAPLQTCCVHEDV